MNSIFDFTSFLFVVLLGAQAIYMVILLVKTILSKDNRKWLQLFSCNAAAFISAGLVILYAIENDYLGWDSLGYAGISLIALMVYATLLIVNIIFKIIEVVKNKKKKINQDKLSTQTIINIIIKPIIIVFLLTLTLCLVEYGLYVIKNKKEAVNYSSVVSASYLF